MRAVKKALTALICLASVLTVTGCNIQKPDEYTIQGVAVDSITTVCKTECTLSDVDVAAGGENCSATYRYTGVDGDKGVSDAKAYHDYLQSHELCVKIEPFDETAGSYTAYIAKKEMTKKDGKQTEVATGFTLKVAFQNDSYTITLTDNLILDNIK